MAWETLIKFMRNEFLKIKVRIESKLIDVNSEKKIDLLSLLKKYEDILNYELERVRAKVSTREFRFEEVRSSKKITFWDIYLLYIQIDKTLLGNSNWSDVETQVQDFFIERKFKYMEEYITGYEKVKENKWNGENDILEELMANKRRFYLGNLRKIRIEDDFFYKELQRFSQNFINYLKQVYNQKYDKSAQIYHIEKKEEMI